MHELSRRDCLRGGLCGGGAFALANLLRLRAASAADRRETSVIFVQLGGGASHLETYDPKPAAPAEYRGAFSPIDTSVPGLSFCELLPQQAKIADRLAIVRSVSHHEASHIALHMVESGYFLRNSANALKGEMPAVGSIVARVRGGAPGGLPAFVSLPKPFAYCGPAHLGRQYSFFEVSSDPSAADFQVNNLGLAKDLSAERLAVRRALLAALDGQPTHRDDQLAALDAFQQQAVELLTSERTRLAFEVARETAKTRDRYGRNPFGQRMLLARRLAESGVPFVVVRMADWDDHDNLAGRMKDRCPSYDQGLAALVVDLEERGLSRQVLVVAMGEFGRTPRINQNGGRDHWPAVMSVLLAGGDYQMGQAIGASDEKGAHATAAPYKPENVLAMVYRHLGIDPALTFLDFTGRPRPVLEERGLIHELL